MLTRGGGTVRSAALLATRAVDLLAAGLAFLPVCTVLALLSQRRRPSPEGEHLLVLFFGSERSAHLKKFGSLDWYLQTNPDRIFRRVTCVNFPVLEPGEEWIDDRIRIVDIATPGRRHFFCFGTLLALVRLWRIGWREGVTVVQVTELSHLALLGFLLSRLLRVPWCISIHSDWESCHRYAPQAVTTYGHPLVRRLLDRLLYPLADQLWPVREAYVSQALRAGVEPCRIRIFRHGLDLTPYLGGSDPKFLRRWGLEGRRLLVSVGRLEGDNHIYDLPPIVRRVRAEFPDALCVLVGGGEERRALEEVIVREGVADAFRLVGWQMTGQVPQFRLNAAVNLCLVGGYSLIEAAASARPVVSYDMEWHGELIEDGVTGRLVPAGDVRAAAEAVCGLLRDPVSAAAMGGRARERTLARHALPEVEAMKADLFRSLLGCGRSS